MRRMRNVDAAILAGGRGERLGGQPKGLLEIGGRTVIARQIEALSPLVREVLLVGGDAYADVAGVRRVADRQPGRGPLAGLEAAFVASDADALIVVGCDLPFLDAGLLTLVRDHAPAAQAAVPRVDSRPQALHARYGRAALPHVQARLQRGELRLLGLLDDLDPEWLDEPALRAIDPTLRGLTNVNTPAELDAARRQA
jgi:molybdopterin-guanine dinucleotide biosynthesis protein A